MWYGSMWSWFICKWIPLLNKCYAVCFKEIRFPKFWSVNKNGTMDRKELKYLCTDSIRTPEGNQIHTWYSANCRSGVLHTEILWKWGGWLESYIISHCQSIKEKNISPMKGRAEATYATESLSLGFPSQLSIIQNRQAAGCTDGDATARVHVEHYRSG